MKKTEVTPKTKWSIDQSHSEIAFQVRPLMIGYVKGLFKTFDASIYTNAKDFKTVIIDLWIDSSSITTGDINRDDYLKSAEFFDVQNHKQISFTSSTMGRSDSEGNHELWGELTMRGITKNVKLMVQFGGIVKDPWGKEKAGFTVTGNFNGRDWGLVWNAATETGGLMVNDEVTITCEIELINVGQDELIMQLETEGDKKTEKMEEK